VKPVFDPTNISDSDLDAAAQQVVTDQQPVHDAGDADIDAAAQAVGESEHAQKLQALDTVFKASSFKDGDRHARVLEVARTTGAPADLVEANIDGFSKAAEAADWNPARFYQDNPILSQILLDRPDAAPVILRHKELTSIQRLGSYLREGFADLNAALLRDLSATSPAFAGAADFADSKAVEIRQTQEKRRAEGEDVPSVIAPQEDLTGIERAIGRGWFTASSPQDALKQVAAGKGIAPPWAVAFNDAFKEQVERASIGAALVWRKLSGRFQTGDRVLNNEPPPEPDTYDLEKRLVDLDNAHAPTSYGEGPVEGAILEATRFLPWMGATAIGTAAAGPWGAFGVNFNLLLGDSYLNLRGQTVDRSTPYAADTKMDDGTAIAAASLYALVQAGVRTQAFHDIAGAWGPVGEALRQGNVKAFTTALMRDATLKNIVTDWGKNALVKQGSAMAREMALQSLLSDATGYLARGYAGHGGTVTEWNAPDLIASGEQAAESALKAWQGSLAMAAGAGVTNALAHSAMVGEALRESNSTKASDKVRALLEYFKDGKAFKAIPETVARLIREESAQSSVPIDRLWMDARALPLLFQAEGAGGGYGADWEPVARGLGGDRLVTDIKAALVSGDKVPIQLEDFLSKWATKPLLMQQIGADLTTQPYYQTDREKAETRARRQQEVTQLASEILSGKVPPRSEPESRLAAAVREHATAAGLSAQEVEKNVALYRAFVRTQAKRFNEGRPKAEQITEDELFANAEVMVRRGQASEVDQAAAAAPPRPPPPAPPARPEPGTREALQEHLRNNDPNVVTQELPRLTPEDLARPAPPAESPAAAKPAEEGAKAETAPAEVKGSRTATVITPQHPNGEPVRYDVVEADTLIPSHTHNFSPHPDFPAGVQERNYLGQPEEQFKVISGAQKLNPAFLLTDTPSPLDGPPLVTAGEKHIVLGGNGRTMMIQRAFADPSKLAEYKAALLGKAAAFGLDPAAIEGMKAPVLVRTTDVPSDAPKETLIAGVRRFNEGMTQQLSARARAIAESKTLSIDTIESIGEVLAANGEATLRDVLRDRPNDILGILRRDGVVNAQNAAQWVSDGQLTSQAKERIEGMFVGRIFENEARYEGTTPELVHKIERAAPYLMRVAGLNPALDVTQTVRGAIDLLNDARRRGIPLSDLTAQGSMFGGPQADPFSAAMAALLEQSTQKAIAARFKSWANYAAVDPRQMAMFGTKPTEEGARAILLQGAEPSLFQRDQKNLIVQHNLTAASLLHADELGGLVAPSIAIGRSEFPMTNFGEITLLGPARLVDPQQGTPVYNADVYSPRWPSTRHLLNGQALRDFVKEIGPLAKNVTAYVGDIENEFSKDGAEGVLARREWQAALGQAFLKERGQTIEPKMRAPPLEHGAYFEGAALRDFFKERGVDRNFEHRGEYHKALSEAALRALDEYAAKVDEVDKGLGDELRKDFLERDFTNGLLDFSDANLLMRDGEKIGKTEVDQHATMDEVLHQLNADPKVRAEFETWAKAKLEGLFAGRYIEKYTDNGNRRRIAYTAENILRELTRQIRAGEGFNYGLGTARSQGAKQFRSVGGIQAERDRVVSHTDFGEAKKQQEERLMTLAGDLRRFHPAAGEFNYLDAVVGAIGDSYRRGWSMDRALRENGFQGVTPEAAQKASTFARELLAMPTEYFEAKPRRVVGINEFAVAVAPKSTSAEALAVLKKHGVDVVKYDPDKEGDREQAIARAAAENELLFQRDAPVMPGLEDAAPLLQAAWHGSPHRFDEFTTQKIGVGEGAQAFGWGLYFAQNPGVAEFYRNKLADSRVLVNGEEYHRPDGAGWSQLSPRDRVIEKMRGVAEALLALRGKADPAEVKAAVRRDLSSRLDAEYARGRASESALVPQLHDQEEALDAIDPKTLQFERGGATYKVDVPESERLLDYDKPLDQQPQRIQDAIREAGLWPETRVEKYIEPEVKTGIGITLRPIERYRGVVTIAGREHRINEGSRTEKDALAGAMPTGGQFYESLQSSFDPKGASEKLRNTGIPGMQYLDNGSRTIAQGGTRYIDDRSPKTHNFVIWDENEVRVLDRYFQSKDQGQIRGWTQRLRDGTRRLFNIVLTEHANLSTFVHESGHVFLELMGDLAERPDAPESIRGDWKDTLAWLGVDRRQDIETKQHEKWARTFEDYLKSGKAPSGELVRVFQRFRLWLSSIYGAAKQVPGSDIDPQIGGIFDRMLATDREIDNQARAAGFDKPLFSTPEEAGMTPAQFREYLESQRRAMTHAAEVANVRTLKDRQRETEAWWKEEAAKAKAEAEKAYDARPDVRAYKLLRLGDPGDEPALTALSGPLNRLALMRELKDADPALRDQVLKKLIGRVANEGEVMPDDIARVLGFNTTLEMLQAVVGAPRKADWVKEQVQAQMTAKHGDIVQEREKLADLVKKALHERPTLDWLMREYEALRRRTVPGDRTKPAPLIESLRDAAALLVGRTPIWELSSARMLSLERKAGEDAFKALANGSFKSALVAKQQQLLSALMHGYTLGALHERDAFHALLERVTDDKARGEFGKAGPELLAGIDRLTEAMGVKSAPPKEIDAQRPTFDNVLDWLVSHGLPAAFDVEVVRQAIADGPDPSKASLTVDTMREVDSAIRQLRKIALDVRFVDKLDQRMTLDELLADINSEAAANNAEKFKPPASYSAAPWWWSKYEKLQAINAAFTDPQYMFEKLGPTARDFFWGGWLKARDAESDLQKRVTREVLKLWDHVPKQDRARRFELLPEDVLPLPADVNRDIHYRDRNWLLMVALNMGNASNKERLLGGYGWKEASVIKALQDHLTHGEMEFVQKVWNLLDKELYPQLAAHYEKLNGIPPKKIEATPLTLTIDGVEKTYVGGYFPAKYDPIAGRTTVGVTQEQAAIAQLYGGTNGAAVSVARGFTKERAKRFSDVVNLQWSVLPAHVLDVVHYTAVDGFVRDAWRAMNERGFRDAVQNYLGPKYEAQLDQWLRVVASARAEEAPKSLEGAMSILSPLRNRYMTAVVGGNLTTMLAHSTIPLEAVFTREIKPQYGIVSLLQAMTGVGWVAQRKQALEKSGQLRDMAEQARHRLDVALAEAAGRRTTSVKVRQFVDEASHFGFDVVLKTTSTILWDARYRQELAAGRPEAEAIAGADSAVQHLYPSSRLAEQPTILRDKRGVGSLLAFYSYFSKLYTQVGRRLWHDDVANFLSADGAGAKVRTLPSMGVTAAYALGTMVSYGALAELMSGQGPEEDEEVPQWLLRKTVGSMFLLLPFGGDLAEGVEYAIAPEGTVRKPSERSSPAVAAYEHMRDALSKAFDSNADDLDRYIAAGELLAFGLRLPVAQPKRTLKYALDPRDTSPAGIVSGAVYGEREGQPANPITLPRRF
jgi:hypothetical protein